MSCERVKGYSEDGALAMAEDQLATIRSELGGARLVILALRGSRSTSSTTTTTTVEGAAESPSPPGDPASGEEPLRGRIGPTGGSLSARRRRILDCSEGVTVSENRGGEFSIKGHGSEDDEPTANFPPPRAGRGKKRARTVDELHAVAAAEVAEAAAEVAAAAAATAKTRN